ncbi:hypothetical protein [Nocardia cyriacigeorgica]|uniref:hypothetical protein n=1 Tax=Nocardia cyriacigeorgica TaxID=135487 RepID=UPI0018942B1E
MVFRRLLPETPDGGGWPAELIFVRYVSVFQLPGALLLGAIVPAHQGRFGSRRPPVQ